MRHGQIKEYERMLAVKVANDYWTHNTAYHNWIIKRAPRQGAVLDVGCGDGLLVAKLADRCRKVIGIDVHSPSTAAAKNRIKGKNGALIMTASFEDFTADEASLDMIIFAASIHHMDMELAIKKAKKLLAPHGQILIVGCAKPAGAFDYFIEALRVVPAKIGSALHGDYGSKLGVPTAEPLMSLKEIRALAQRYLPDAEIRRGLYYRYLLSWTNSGQAAPDCA